MAHRLTKEELDEQFELFLKESVSDDSIDFGGSLKQPLTEGIQKSALKPTTTSWWEDDEHSGGGKSADEKESRFIKAKKFQPENEALQGSKKSYTWSSELSQPVEEEEEDSGNEFLKKDGQYAVVLSQDNLNKTEGLDTLEEEEEKARFFGQLEAGASSTIDYSKLNRELDLTTSTISTKLRKAEEAGEQSVDDQRMIRDTEDIRNSPGSPHYSEDFEEENSKEPLEKSNISEILAKVSLYDSLDNTGGGAGKKDTEGSLDRGLSNIHSGGSEMEALHEAYKQIHVVDDSDDPNPHYKPVVSPFPSQQTRQSLQPDSTNESELPTAEELMKPIRPEEDYIRGFTLQPFSDIDPKSYFQDVPHTESRQKQPGRVVTEPSEPHLTWSIKDEVKKLMQDHQSSTSHMSSDAGKAKKHPALCSSSISYPNKSSVRKSTVAPMRGRKVLGATAVTPRSKVVSKAANRAAGPAKIQCSISRGPQDLVKATLTKWQDKDEDTAEQGLKVSSELVASVQSLVTVLQQQINKSSHQEPADAQKPLEDPQMEIKCHLSNENRIGDSSKEELKFQLAQKERQLQMMKEEAEELQLLKQQHWVLQSKLHSVEEESRKQGLAVATDPATQEKFHQIDKEMKEQETLIKGYQQENEKLYLQMKTQQARSKSNEEAMFNENQRLLNELTFTREQLNKTSRPFGNVCVMDHTQRITELLAQITTFQRNEDKLSADIHRLKQEKQALEVELQLIKKERDLAKGQIIPSSGIKTSDMRKLEDKHREEVLELKRKLQWFSENQELLDKDAEKLKAATAEIHQLKEQVGQLKMEVGKRSSEQQKKARDRSVETKRMKDLERQVRELEQILKHRNPNSLPALIYAAASASSQEKADSQNCNITILLERRIQRLVAELESRDEEAKYSMRAMEQQLHRLKLYYEQQISELQLQHKQQEIVTTAEPRVSQVQSMEEELQKLKEAYQKKEKGLFEQIESLQQQLKHKAQQSPGRHQRHTEAAFSFRIERLNQELSAKTRTIQELSRTVARMQKERTSTLSGPYPETCLAETKRHPFPTKTCAVEETFPAAQYDKTYQPTVFTGSHISEVLQENKALKQRLEQLQLQGEQEREALKSVADQAKDELQRIKEHSAEQLSSMKEEHLRVIDQLRTTYALEHSSSKVAELTNKLNAQEIKVKHLQQQLTELQETKDALAISRTREEALQNQLTRLLTELKEAKEAQSSEVKFLCSLERKLLNMELRHEHREKELQQVISGSWQTPEVDQLSEVERWRRLAQDKTKELEAFRLELDSILDILRHLQRQGVVFSTLDHQQLPRGANNRFQ